MTEEGFRHEFKYFCSTGQAAILRARVSPFMKPDPHASGGTYTIRSLYFDDFDNNCYYKNENGTDPREKFRIRIYEGSTAFISLECKRKEHGMTRKKSCRISEEQCRKLMEGFVPEVSEGQELLRKLTVLMKTRLMRPAVIVEYDRMPFICADGNVRVTFDMAIRSSPSCGRFLDPVIGTRPIMAPGQIIMEVKYDELIPDHIMDSLQTGELRQTNFSKYYLCRKFSKGAEL